MSKRTVTAACMGLHVVSHFGLHSIKNVFIVTLCPYGLQVISWLNVETILNDSPRVALQF